MFTEKILYNTNVNGKLPTITIYIFFIGAYISFILFAIDMAFYNINANLSIFYIPIALLAFLSLFIYLQLTNKATKIFNQKITDIENLNIHTLNIVELQEYRHHLFEIEKLLYLYPTNQLNKNINIQKKILFINQKKQEFKTIKNIGFSENIYEIAHIIQKTLLSKEPQEIFFKNNHIPYFIENIIQKHQSISKKFAAGVVLLYVGPIFIFSIHYNSDGTANIMPFILGYCIFSIFFIKYKIIENFKTEYLQINLEKFNISKSLIEEYFQLSYPLHNNLNIIKNTTIEGIRPPLDDREKNLKGIQLSQLSLVFADIIKIITINITERKKELNNFKKLFTLVYSFIPFLPFHKKFPLEVQQFFAEQNKKLIKDANDIRKFIVLWKDLEIKKLAELHLNAEIPELSLQNKRREILLKNLEKIK